MTPGGRDPPLTNVVRPRAPGAYLVFGLDNITVYRCGRCGEVIVCLCAMDDPSAYTLVPPDATAMSQGYLILHNVSHHIVLRVAYPGDSVDNNHLTKLDSVAPVAEGTAR